ncbi:MAG: CHAT domain-containing protein [Myxococcales bacterium]|nr:CHAT domain-containing protein [Myxococcales bacterium]
MEKNHTTGDALVSLASVFALAGSPPLLASLWEVPDASTHVSRIVGPDGQTILGMGRSILRPRPANDH